MYTGCISSLDTLILSLIAAVYIVHRGSTVVSFMYAIDSKANPPPALNGSILVNSPLITFAAGKI